MKIRFLHDVDALLIGGSYSFGAMEEQTFDKGDEVEVVSVTPTARWAGQGSRWLYRTDPLHRGAGACLNKESSKTCPSTQASKVTDYLLSFVRQEAEATEPELTEAA